MKRKVTIIGLVIIMALSFTACRDRKAEAEEREKTLVEIEVEQKEKAQDAVDEYTKSLTDIQNKGEEVEE